MPSLWSQSATCCIAAPTVADFRSSDLDRQDKIYHTSEPIAAPQEGPISAQGQNAKNTA
jgi:hypothetical protein